MIFFFQYIHDDAQRTFIRLGIVSFEKKQHGSTQLPKLVTVLACMKKVPFFFISFSATAPQPPPPALPYPDLLHPNSALLTTTSGGGSGGGGAGNGNRPKIYSENSFIVDEQLAEDECLCEVCCDLIEANKGLLNEIDESMSCKHKVCANCWKLHLATKCQQPSSSQVIELKVPTT